MTVPILVTGGTGTLGRLVVPRLQEVGRQVRVLSRRGHDAPDGIRGYLRTRGRRRLIMPVGLPGKAGRAYRDGENLSLDGAMVGQRTWEEFLAERISQTR